MFGRLQVSKRMDTNKSINNISFISRKLSKLLGVFFKLLYSQLAWAYDFVAATVSLGLWNNWILSIQPYLEGSRILEVGFGTGHLISSLNGDGKNHVGIDLSWQMCTLARKRLSATSSISTLVNGQAQRLPFMNEVFDQVVTTFPSDYIKDDTSWSEISRVLVPGGELLILISARITGSTWYYRLVRWSFQISNQSFEWEDGLIEPFTHAGLNCVVITYKVQHSELMMIRGKKNEE
jgi:ubiquinone/menaquinone biosynthesis C-methylase UbiE